MTNPNGNTLLVVGFGQTPADQYDFEDRLISRSTPQGTVMIAYDGDGNQEELELGCHGARKPSRTLAA